MDSIVVGRDYVDNYIVLFTTKILTNVTSVDSSKVCIFLMYNYHNIVFDIHLKDDHKHKKNQTKEDTNYNYPLYYEAYHTRASATVNDLKYIIGIYFVSISDHI